jgi:hypothetical protein
VTVPAGLAERLFRALFDDFDLITVDGTYIAVPADGTILAFSGATLAEVAGQISTSERSTSTMPDPFRVDENRALDALALAWSDQYEIRVAGGQWQAWHRDGSIEDLLTGSTPDELNRAIRADWARREPAEQ